MNQKPAVPHPAYVQWLVEFKRAPDAPDPSDTLRVFPTTVEAFAWLDSADATVEAAYEPRPITIH